MNHVALIGRLTKDPDVRYSQGENQKAIARYTLAVDRPGKKQEGQQNSDFISCVAFDRTAEFAEKHLSKGTKIAVQGSLRTGSYTNKEGQKVYTTDVIVMSHFFCESKNTDNREQAAPEEMPGGDGFMSIPDGVEDDGLPFN